MNKIIQECEYNADLSENHQVYPHKHHEEYMSRQHVKYSPKHHTNYGEYDHVSNGVHENEVNSEENEAQPNYERAGLFEQIER